MWWLAQKVIRLKSPMKRTSRKYLKILLKAALYLSHVVMIPAHTRKSSAFGHKTRLNRISVATVLLVKAWVQH
ncbi:Uncharacterised protein [Vibrio cholerae]|nr:Uncharacterised protein [Vibrio cholerae]